MSANASPTQRVPFTASPKFRGHLTNQTLTPTAPKPHPAPAETLLGAETLSDELQIADIMDGKLPQYLTETRAEKTEAQLAAARYARGKAAVEKCNAKEKLSDAEFSDMCFYLDPASVQEPPRRRYK